MSFHLKKRFLSDLGHGSAAGPKLDATSVYANFNSVPRKQMLMGKDRLDRWARSESKFAENTAPEEKEEIERLVTAHPQFTI